MKSVSVQTDEVFSKEDSSFYIGKVYEGKLLPFLYLTLNTFFTYRPFEKDGKLQKQK